MKVEFWERPVENPKEGRPGGMVEMIRLHTGSTDYVDRIATEADRKQHGGVYQKFLDRHMNAISQACETLAKAIDAAPMDGDYKADFKLEVAGICHSAAVVLGYENEEAEPAPAPATPHGPDTAQSSHPAPPA